MRFARAVLSSAPALSVALEVGVRHALLQAYSRAAPAKPHEPDFVAALLVDGIPLFGSHLNAVCNAAGGSATLTGIFCHGRPEVEHGGNGCELGDLLFAHFHTDASGVQCRNALLLQVKMSSSPAHVVGGSEQVQLALYSSWPAFKYKRTSTALNGQSREVLPKASHPGAQYLLLDDGDPTDPSTGLIGTLGATPALVASPSAVLRGSVPLSECLVQFLLQQTGRPFKDQTSATAAGARGWSTVVWDLLAHGATHAFTRAKRAKLVNHSRSVSSVGFVHAGAQRTRGAGLLGSLFGPNNGAQLAQWLESGANGPPPFDGGLDHGDDQSGFGLVVIETSEGFTDQR